MRVAVAGPGLMGSQIGVEYALGGHDVVFVGRDLAAARERIERAFAVVLGTGVYADEAVDAARQRVTITGDIAAVGSACDLVVESIGEDLAAKGTLLAEAGRIAPDAVLASNTSSLSILAIGEACGFPERTIGTHYGNPALLMPLVEVIVTERTRPGTAEPVEAALRAMGKRPVRVNRDVPGFLWNRMQLALLREAVWLAENGVAEPEAIDLVVRDAMARRWRQTGPFETAALGGAAIFERIANNLWPELSAADSLSGLRQWLPGEPGDLGDLRDRRDRALAAELRRERGGGDR